MNTNSNNGDGIYLFNLPNNILINNINLFIDCYNTSNDTHDKLTVIGSGYYGYNNTINFNCFIGVKNSLPYIIIYLNNQYASNINGNFLDINMLYNFECIIPLN